MGRKRANFDESKEYELKNNPGRRNFTIAHELGHWFLHKNLAQENLFGMKGNVLICRGINNKTDNKERQANIFASHLLMPERFLKTQLSSFTTPLNEYDLRELAKIFQVSKQAMKILLVDELKLLHYVQVKVCITRVKLKRWKLVVSRVYSNFLSSELT